jgi:hypothetical protein
MDRVVCGGVLHRKATGGSGSTIEGLWLAEDTAAGQFQILFRADYSYNLHVLGTTEEYFGRYEIPSAGRIEMPEFAAVVSEDPDDPAGRVIYESPHLPRTSIQWSINSNDQLILTDGSYTSTWTQC